MGNVFAVLFFLSLQVVWGQSPHLSEESGRRNIQDRRYQEMIVEHWGTEAKRDKEILARREADAQVREFYRKAQHFVTLWQSFARQLNEGKTFNAKLAKQVSKAYHDMEKSDGWPIGRSQ